MASTDSAEADERAELDLPRTNPVPLIVASLVALAILGGLVVMLVSGADDSAGGTEGGDQASVTVTDEFAPVPDLDFIYFDGTDGSFDDFRGSPVVLNFFAEWCAPCVAEMPDLQTVSEEYDGQVTFVGLETNDSLENGRKIAEETGVEYTLAHDPSGDDLANAFGLRNMPTTIFIDADGRVVRSWTGRIEPDELRTVIDHDLLAATEDTGE